MPVLRTSRYDETPDARFYREPRLVEHIDARAIAAVEELYRELLPQGGDLLDLMSSWVSHSPSDVAYGRIVGLGMNAIELAANPRLDAYVVHDLNADPRLPFETASVDAVTICVSIQYLTQAALVLREAARVARPGAPIVITFSNRCFPTKAVAIGKCSTGAVTSNWSAGISAKLAAGKRSKRSTVRPAGAIRSSP